MRKFVECPLVGCLCSIHMPGMIEGCFSHLFFCFLNVHLLAIVNADTDNISPAIKQLCSCICVSIKFVVVFLFFSKVLKNIFFKGLPTSRIWKLLSSVIRHKYHSVHWESLPFLEDAHHSRHIYSPTAALLKINWPNVWCLSISSIWKDTGLLATARTFISVSCRLCHVNFTLDICSKIMWEEAKQLTDIYLN